MQPRCVLGIDPGFGRLGYAVVELAGREKYTVHTYGCLETNKDALFEQRLVEIDLLMSDLCKTFSPDLVMVEQLFFAKNVTTGLQVAHARGVVLLAATKANIPVQDIHPQHVKQALVGNGAAQKQQVQKMTQLMLRLKELPRPDDAADALAIALCGFLHNR